MSYGFVLRIHSTSHAPRARAPRRDLPRPQAHREPCAARRVGVDSRREHAQRPTGNAPAVLRRLKEHTVSAHKKGRTRGRAAAHRVPRRCPATAGPPSEALKDRGPAKKRGLRRWGCIDLRPDTPAGQNLSTTTVGKGPSRECKAWTRGIRARPSYLYRSRPTTLQEGARTTC